MIPFTQPEWNSKAFNCPHCGAFANQSWRRILIESSSGYQETAGLSYCECTHCNKFMLWYDGKMILPLIAGIVMPNPDLPEDIKRDYEEARSIMNQSPRGAAALLRLAIQKLCRFLGEEGKNINADIGNLVKKGLPVKVQQSLDIVRVIGNNAVHPGQLDISDDLGMASKLFLLINLIADVMITQPNEVDKLFSSLPENQLAGIRQRDSGQQ